jgi:hypothetical protein
MKLQNNVSRISRLKDIDLSNLSDLKVLQFNADTDFWEAVTMNEASGTVEILDDLTDVQVASAVSDQVLQFDGTNWVPGEGGGSGGVSEELESIGFNVNANNEIKIGAKGYRAIPYDAVIKEWKLIVNTDSNNNITINMDKTNDLINYTNIISVEVNTTLNNWDVSLNKSDIIRFHIEEITNIKNMWFFMDIERVVT